MAKNSADPVYEMKGTFDGRVLVPDHEKMMARVLNRYLGEELLITVTKFRYKRSDAQNRYIHGVIVPCVRAWMKETSGTMPTHDEIYVWLRTVLLGYKANVTEIMGEQVITMTGKRFSTMNTKEFAEAVDIILQSMAEKGCVIPEPRQNNFVTDFTDD